LSYKRRTKAYIGRVSQHSAQTHTVAALPRTLPGKLALFVYLSISATNQSTKAGVGFHTSKVALTWVNSLCAASSALCALLHPQVNHKGLLWSQRLSYPDIIPSPFFKNYQLVSIEPKFLLVHMMCAILGVSFYFCFLCCLNKVLRSETFK
jgi:hypothetical protein